MDTDAFSMKFRRPSQGNANDLLIGLYFASIPIAFLLKPRSKPEDTASA